MAISALISALAPTVLPMLTNAIGGKKGGGSGGSGGGGMASTAAPMVMGAVQSIQGLMNRKKAEGMSPAAEDPQVRMNLSRIQRQAQALRTGTQSSVVGMQLAKSSKQAQLNALKVGGIAGLSAASRARGAEAQALVNLSQQNLAAAQQQDTLASTIIQKMSQRRLGIQREKQQKLETRAEAQIAGGAQNLAAAIGSMGKALPSQTDASNLNTVRPDIGNTSTQSPGAEVPETAVGGGESLGLYGLPE
jgi:hypothetical protein